MDSRVPSDSVVNYKSWNYLNMFSSAADKATSDVVDFRKWPLVGDLRLIIYTVKMMVTRWTNAFWGHPTFFNPPRVRFFSYNFLKLILKYKVYG